MGDRYKYNELREELFSDNGQRTFLQVRDHTMALLEKSGAVTMHHAIAKASGSLWLQMGCIDRLVELRELHEVKQAGEVTGQDRIFVKP